MNAFFTSVSVSAEWSKGIYRGITLSNSMLYSSVINARLSKWVEISDILVDEQNGFRKKQSTMGYQTY